MREYHQPPLTRTNRLLRAELLPYFYRSCCTFTVDKPSRSCYYDCVQGMGRLLRAMGPVNRANIHDAMMICRFSKECDVRQLRDYWEGVDFTVGEAFREFGRAYGVEDRAWGRKLEGDEYGYKIVFC